MQNDFQLTVGAMRRRLRTCYPHQEVVTLEADGPVRASYAQVAERVDRLGRVLERLGVKPGERVATFAWNNQRHYELYMAVPSYGAVLHTLNIRLFPEQVVYIVDHAQDGVVFVDSSLVEPLAKLAPQLSGVRQYVVMGDGDLDALPGRGLLRAAARRGRRGRVRVARDRRARRGGAVLHERHDRQPEGRALLAPLGVAALDDDLRGRRRRPVLGRQGPGHRADVPRQRVGAALRRGADRRRAAAARSLPAGRASGALRRGRARDAGGRGADRARRAARARRRARRRPQLAARRDLRRLGRAAHADGGLRAPRRAPAAGVGDDRDEPHRHRGPAPGRRRRGRGALGVPHDAGPDGAVDGDPPQRGRRRDRGAWAVGGRALLRGPQRRRQVHRRRLAAHGRHRRARRPGLRAHHRPREGPHQVRRRVDLLGGGGDAPHRPPGRARGRGDRHARRASGASGRWPAWRSPRARASHPADLREHLSSGLAHWQVPDAFAFIDEVPKTSVGKFDKKVLRRALADGELEVERSEGAAVDG